MLKKHNGSLIAILCRHGNQNWGRGQSGAGPVSTTGSWSLLFSSFSPELSSVPLDLSLSSALHSSLELSSASSAQIRISKIVYYRIQCQIMPRSIHHSCCHCGIVDANSHQLRVYFVLKVSSRNWRTMAPLPSV